MLISRFLLEFFVTEEPRGKSGVMRPLTNSNFVCDFYRYRASEYYGVVTRYLKSRDQLPPSDYELQYDKVMRYFWRTKVLHKYGSLLHEGAMSALPNTKQLQPVTTTEDGRSRIGQV